MADKRKGKQRGQPHRAAPPLPPPKSKAMPVPPPKSKAMPKKRHGDSARADAPAARRHAAAKRRALQPAAERGQAVEACHPEAAAPRIASAPREVVDKWLAEIGVGGECARRFRGLNSDVQCTVMGNYDVVMSR